MPVSMSSKRRLPLHYGTPTKPGTPHIRARLFSQSIYSPRPPPPPTATYASNPAEHLQLAGHAISYAMAACWNLYRYSTHMLGKKQADGQESTWAMQHAPLLKREDTSSSPAAAAKWMADRRTDKQTDATCPS